MKTSQKEDVVVAELFKLTTTRSSETLITRFVCPCCFRQRVFPNHKMQNFLGRRRRRTRQRREFSINDASQHLLGFSTKQLFTTTNHHSKCFLAVYRLQDNKFNHQAVAFAFVGSLTNLFPSNVTLSTLAGRLMCRYSLKKDSV